MMDRIARDLVAAYGSLDQPNWSFFTEKLATSIYQDLIDQFRAIANVVETTDLNDDTSRCLSIAMDGCSVGVRLSLVGRYACVHEATDNIVTDAQTKTSRLVESISRILEAGNVKRLAADSLLEKIEFGGECRTVYSVLFSSDELFS